MNIIKTEIEGVLVIEPRLFGDQRGYFYESFNADDFAKQTGLDVTFVQDNESMSKYGVLRGLHYQKGEFAQSKLVRAVSGKVLDVAVDIRKNSPTFGRYVAVELCGDSHMQLFLPRGIAHGFVVLSNQAVFQYKCDNYYHPEAEGAILWSDAQIGVDWRIPKSDIILSEKDKVNPLLSEIEPLLF